MVLTKVDQMGTGVSDREGHDDPPTDLVQLKVLVYWEQEGHSGGAKPRQSSTHHQDDD